MYLPESTISRRLQFISSPSVCVVIKIRMQREKAKYFYRNSQLFVGWDLRVFFHFIFTSRQNVAIVVETLYAILIVHIYA